MYICGQINRTMNKIIKQLSIFASTALYLGFSFACQPSTQVKTSAGDSINPYEQQIIGRWQQQEINEGVLCSVFFMPQGRLSLFFLAPDGRSKLRPSEWSINGDSLHILEQTGLSSLFIEQMNDSLMILRSADSMPIIFERKATTAK